MSKESSHEPYFSDVVLRIRHNEDVPPCPTKELANGFRRSLGDEEKIRIQPASAAMRDGWRPVIVEVDAMLTIEDFERIDDFSEVLSPPIIDAEPTANRSILLLEIRDPILDVVLNKSHSYQLLTDYTATPSYEEISLRISPVESLTPLLDSLEEISEVKMLRKNTYPLRRLRMVRQTPYFEIPVLLASEESILRELENSGWYEYPRPQEVSLASMSENLGTHPGVLSVKIRNINRKLSTMYFRDSAR